MKSALKYLIAVLAVGAVFVGRAEAAAITVVPASQTIAPGASTTVEIRLSGLTAAETVGGFGFDLTWLDSILDATGFVSDPAGAMGAGADTSFTEANPTGPSPLHSEVFAAFPGPTEPALHALQAPAFVLGRITFLGVTEGLSPLTLSFPGNAFLSNYDGSAVIAAAITNSSICVDDPQTPGNRCAAAPIPEPTSILLLGSGLASVVAARRRRKQQA